jgi:hypothetical protein
LTNFSSGKEKRTRPYQEYLSGNSLSSFPAWLWSGQLSIRFGRLSIPLSGEGVIVSNMAAKSEHHF